MQLLFLLPALLAAVANSAVFTKTNQHSTLRTPFGIAKRHPRVDVGGDHLHDVSVAHSGASVALGTLRCTKGGSSAGIALDLREHCPTGAARQLGDLGDAHRRDTTT